MRCIYLLLCYLAELDMLLRSMKVYVLFTSRYCCWFCIYLPWAKSQDEDWLRHCAIFTLYTSYTQSAPVLSFHSFVKIQVRMQQN